jgi:hypothetical protein
MKGFYPTSTRSIAVKPTGSNSVPAYIQIGLLAGIITAAVNLLIAWISALLGGI